MERVKRFARLMSVPVLLIAVVESPRVLGQSDRSGFAAKRWTGAWGSDGPIEVGDLTGDGKADVFMWRDSDKSWTVNISTGSGFTMRRWTGAWGSDGPIHVADLNGDKRADVFMWRDSDKSWTVNLSTGAGFLMQRWTGAWGSDGPIRAGDLNGDGKADVFMWRDSDKSWTVNLSTVAGFQMQRWTGAWGSDGPTFTGDLNGDGKTDVFMWRDSDKSWTVNLSTGSGFQMQRWTGAWGSDGPIRTGDLNGDGKTDVFMWRDADKSWTVNLSTGAGFAMQQWFGACDGGGPVVQGDFNGDHRQDVAIWRDDFKQWFINFSTGTGFALQVREGAWGSDGPSFAADLNADARTDVFMWRAADNSWTVNLAANRAIGANENGPACGNPKWTSHGPYSVANMLSYQDCAGKIDDIQISPDYDGHGTSAMFLASRSSSSFLGFRGGGGGIWRSSDFTGASPTWVPLTDHIDDASLTDAKRVGILDVPSVAIDPSKPRTLYAATNKSPAALLKSTDGGDSWKVVADGAFGVGSINRVAVDSAGFVYVATTTGLHVSQTGGTTFNDASGTLTGLVFDDVICHVFPGASNSTTLVAAIDLANPNANSRTGIYELRRNRGGFSWTATSITLKDLQQQAFVSSRIAKIQMSASPQSGATLAMTTADGDPGLLNVFRAQRDRLNAITWVPQWRASPRESDCRDAANRESCFGAQGGYDLGVGAQPDGRVYGGGVGLGQSDGAGKVVNIQDTGAGFITGKTIHVDEHVIAYSPQDRKIYVGTDGGLFRFTPKADLAPGVDAWETLNLATLRNMLSESVASSPSDPMVVVAGHQDNGLSSNADGNWQYVRGGNEGERVWFDRLDATGKTAYAFDASNQDFLKSTDGARTFAKLAGPGARSLAIAFHPSEQGRFMVTAPATGTNFTVQETLDGWQDTTKLKNLAPPIVGLGIPTALAYADAFRYVAVAGRLLRGRVDAQGQITWDTPFNGATIVSVVTDPGNPNSVWFATGANVFYKADQRDALPWTVGGGGNLIDATGIGTTRLAFSVNRIALAESRGGNQPVLYAATPGGVFRARDPINANTQWIRLGTGLPDGYVSDVVTGGPSHFVFASLFGRGVFWLLDYAQ